MTSSTQATKFESYTSSSSTVSFGFGGSGGVANVSSSTFPAASSTSSISSITTATTFYQVEQLTYLWIVFVFIVVGNATVLGTLLLSKGHKSRMNFFIKNLAAADLCVGLIQVQTDIIWRITISWNAGLILCKLIKFMQCVVTYSSTYVLVALSIDRYDAITHPMNFSGSWKRARILIACAWGLSILFSTPSLFFFNISPTDDYGIQCWMEFCDDVQEGDSCKKWIGQVYMTLVAVTLFFIPAVLISACYIIIVRTIWRKGKAMANSTANATAASNELADEPESRRASSRGLIPKAKVKTVKMTFVIIFVFILCWSPYMVYDLLQVYDLITMNPAVATFFQSLAPLNSAANPLIYCLFSTNIGTKIGNILCCRKKQEVLPTGLTTTTNSSTLQQQTSTGGKHVAAPSRCPSNPKTNSSVTFRTAASLEA